MQRARRASIALASIALALAAGGCNDEAKPPPAAGSAGSATAVAPATAIDAGAAAAAGLPVGRDAEGAGLVKAGAACEVKDDSISLSCKERQAAGEYAFQHQQSVELAATCVELLRNASVAIKLTAAHCLDRLTARAVTPVLAAALDAIEAEPSAKVRGDIAWGINGAEAATAKLEDRVLALVARYQADDEKTAGNVLDTLFPQYMIGDGPKPPLRAQQFVLDAFARPGGWMYYRATDLIRLVDDKPAACKAVVSAIKIDGVEWWRALGAFNSLGAPCAESAPAVLDVILAMYGKGTIDDPAAVRFFAERFELTPALRKRAAAALRAVRKKTPAWQRKGVDEAAAAFAKPWAPPAP